MGDSIANSCSDARSSETGEVIGRCTRDLGDLAQRDLAKCEIRFRHATAKLTNLSHVECTALAPIARQLGMLGSPRYVISACSPESMIPRTSLVSIVTRICGPSARCVTAFEQLGRSGCRSKAPTRPTATRPWRISRTVIRYPARQMPRSPNEGASHSSWPVNMPAATKPAAATQRPIHIQLFASTRTWSQNP